MFFLPGPVLAIVIAGGDAHAPRLETGAVLAHAPGSGRDGIAAVPVPAAADIVTATSRAPDTSKYTLHILMLPLLVKNLMDVRNYRYGTKFKY